MTNIQEKLLLQRRAGLITEAEYSEYNEIIFNINEAYLLNEGFWENAKYALSKLGRYKAGGQIFGKGKIDAESAIKIKALLKKSGNEIIDKLDDSIKLKTPEFPNNKSQEDFIDMCLEISKIYDGLVASTKKPPTDSEFIPIDAANAIINDLREYVKEFLDVKLAAVYSVTNETQEIDEENGEETEDERLERKREEFKSKTSDTKEKIEKGDLASFDSERIKTLKSWKLPLSAMGLGLSFGALGWLIKALCTEEGEVTYNILKTKAETLTDIRPGEGATQVLNRAFDIDLNPNSSPEEFLDAIKKIGGGNLDKGIEMFTAEGGIFTDSEAAKSTIQAIADNPGKYGDTLKDVFKGDWAGTGETPGDTLVTQSGGSLKMIVIQKLTKTILVTTTKYALAAPVLKIIGAGLLVGGAAIALARWKGRKSSRAQVLNDLYQNLRPIEPTQNNPEIIDAPLEKNQDLSGGVPKKIPVILPPDPVVDKNKSTIETDVKAISGLNRNGQIALVLSRISSNLSLGKILGKDTIENYTDPQLKQNMDNQGTPAAKVSNLILTLRKNPDLFLKKMEGFLGVKFEKRSRAMATSPSKDTRAQTQTVSENPILFKDILNEAMIDDIFAEFKITPDMIKNNKIELLALIGSMYAKEEDTALSIVNPEKLGLNDSDKKLLQSLGFAPQPGGNYVFLGKDQTKQNFRNPTTPIPPLKSPPPSSTTPSSKPSTPSSPFTSTSTSGARVNYTIKEIIKKSLKEHFKK